MLPLAFVLTDIKIISLLLFPYTIPKRLTFWFSAIALSLNNYQECYCGCHNILLMFTDGESGVVALYSK